MARVRRCRGGFALALLLLLSLWLAGQGAHDLLVHAGPPGHGADTHHASCWLYHGLQVMDAVPAMVVAPANVSREAVADPATPRRVALPASRPLSRGPPAA